MKKIYTTPILISNGEVLRETMGPGPIVVESPTQQSLGAGRVGFYL